FALDSSGSVWGWGDNSWGQIGNGQKSYNVDLPLNASGFSSLEAISAGNRHVLALRQNGEVWAWGAGDVGQLGDGNMGGQYSVLAPKRVQGLPSNIVSIDAGAGGSGSSSFAVTSDGKV